MKDKEEKNLQFVLRYYRHGKLDTTKALNKITSHSQQNNLHRLWIFSSGVAAAILICIVSYTLLSRSDNNMISVTADAGITRHFLPDSTLAILSKGSTLEYDSDNYGKKSREVNMSGKVFFSVRRNEQSPFTATAMYAQVKVLGTEFEIDERMQDTLTNVYVKSGKVMFKGRNSAKGIILTKDMSGTLKHGDEMPEITSTAFPNPSAWATGKFIYKNTPIDAVMKELSLYYETSLYASEHFKTITAEFKTDSLDEIISLIEKTLDIKITKKD